MNELTTTFRIESPPAWLEIGYDAENNWRTVTINCEYWFNIDANGVVVLMYKPACSKPAYPLKTGRSGNNIVWTPESAELVAGVGTMQAFFEVNGDTIGASKKIPCEVDGSLLGSASGGTPPWAIDVIEEIKTLTGHYPYIADGKLYVWDSVTEEWVEFTSTGGGAVDSVNGKTGTVVLNASDVGALPSSYTPPVVSVNGKAGAVTLGAADVHALPDSTVIPAEVTEQTISGWGFTKNTGTYSKPSGGIPKTDLAQAVQTSLGKADTALQTAPVTSVNSKTGAVVLKTSDLTNDSGFQTEPFEIPITRSGSTYTTTATAADILANAENCFISIQGTNVFPDLIVRPASNVVEITANILTTHVNTASIGIAAIFVVVNNGTVTVTVEPIEAQLLPDVTASDNGKFLRVVSGAWAAASVPTAESNSFGGGS